MLIKVEIKNFLSIKEPEIIKINNNITTVIGKNESGKTTILKAISKLNGKKIEKKEKNTENKNGQSHIIGTFCIPENDVKIINRNYQESNNYGFYCLPETNGDLYYTIKVDDIDSAKKYNLYFLDSTNKYKALPLSIFHGRIVKVIKDLITKNKSVLNQEQLDFLMLLSNSQDEEALIALYNEKIPSLSFDETIKDELSNIFAQVEKNYWIKILPKYNFISFSSFDDVLGDTVNVDDLQNNIQAKNILRIGKIDIDELIKAINDGDEILLSNIESKYIDIVTKKFKEIFQQVDDDFKLRIRAVSGKKEIYFLTHDKTSKNDAINISERSDGFRWYLSIYLTLYDYIENKDGNDNYILLIDEPNLYLHAGAQRDLLNKTFKEDFKNIQIIYTTHSPYMIDANNSFSLRIVEKDLQTNIYNNMQDYSLHTKGNKDVDALTPVLTTLQLNFSNNLIIDNNDRLIVVEGIQDVYILNSFINLLKFNEKLKNVHLIPCFGSEKVPFMFGYLYGLGYDVYALVDDDKAGNKAITTICEDDETNDLANKLIKYSIVNTSGKRADFLMENLFSSKDKASLLPEKSTVFYKKIFDEYQSIPFEKETLDNFKKILDNIESLCNNSDTRIKKIHEEIEGKKQQR